MSKTETIRAIMKAVLAGHTNRADIAKVAGVPAGAVHHYLSPVYDSKQWESDRKRHAEFFGGLSPQAEYDKHTEKRKSSDDY